GRDGHLTVKKLSQGGLPLVLSQTFRAIIHSRMKVGMENYRTQYPHADVVLFEPDREDADIFFASIFSYSQRKRLCAAAYHKTRQKLASHAAAFTPKLARHGIRLRRDRLADHARALTDALTDARPLHAGDGRRSEVRQTTRDLAHTLAHLERWLATARGRLAPPAARAGVAARSTLCASRVCRFSCRPWRRKSDPAAPVNGSSRRASRCSIVTAFRMSR